MFAIAFLFVRVLCDCFELRRRLEAEILVLRHQLNVLQQRAPRRLYLTWADRALFVWLYCSFPRILNTITIVRPETIVRWHRKGFSAFWRWKSRPLGGRPQIDKELRDLIRRMSFENPLWGAPHIHGELLKLGFDVAQSTVSKYMVPRRGRPSQTWKTFLRNHADGIASIDLFVVPTIAFEQLYAFLVLGHGRRQLLWFAVTRHPTAEWLARQITDSPGTGRRHISSATTTEPLAAYSHAASRRWAFGTGPRHSAHCLYRKPYPAMILDLVDKIPCSCSRIPT